MKKNKYLCDTPCFNCPYDGSLCEDWIHVYPQFGAIKDMIFQRENFDYHDCNLFNFVESKRNDGYVE